MVRLVSKIRLSELHLVWNIFYTANAIIDHSNYSFFPGSHLPPALPTTSQGMVANPIYEGEGEYETIDDCQEDYRDAKLMQLATVDGIKGTSLRDGGQPPPFPRNPPNSTPANIPMGAQGNGTGQYSVDPDYCTATNPAGAKSTKTTTDDLHDSDTSDADSSDSYS